MYHDNDRGFLQSRQKYYRGTRDDNFDEELNNLFNKKFRFRFDHKNWSFPDQELWFTTPPWTIKEFEILKSRLNFHKSQLNDFNIEEWSSHTRRTNPSGEVCWKIRNTIDPEFLTQAWTKFYECAYTYNIIPSQASFERKMVSLHLCEAPGAFITSLNHYLKINHPGLEWNWIASTLNPYYEGNSPSNMISDDRFMFHTLDHWDFGLDNTGNLMDWDNSQAIIKRAKSLGKVMLVTADGSIDCLQKPDAQEEITSPLHYCEIVTALQVLSEDGTLVFKLFTTFEHSTVNLLYIINHLFKEVNIYKPVTSRQGNSEVYAVCLGYKGYKQIEPYIDTLKQAYGTEQYSKQSLFRKEDIPNDFLKQIEECGYYFSSIQCQVINNNLQAYLMQNVSFSHDVKKIRNVVSATFLRLYNLKPLDYDEEILKGDLHNDDVKINTNPRYHRGSYTERQMYDNMSIKEKCKNLTSFLQADILSNPLIFINEQINWLNMYEENSILELKFTYGKPIDKINSSKFIFIPIFKIYQQLIAEEAFKKIITQRAGRIELNSDDKNIYGCKVATLTSFDHCQNYASYEKDCFQELVQHIKDLSLGDSLMFNNFIILTHFNVSILYILCKISFEKVGFTATGGIVLCNLKNKEYLKYILLVKSECERAKSDSKDVLSALPVKVTNSEKIFNNIVYYNNTFYRNKCMEYLCLMEHEV